MADLSSILGSKDTMATTDSTGNSITDLLNNPLFSSLASMFGGNAIGNATLNPNYQKALDTLKDAQGTIAGTMTPTANDLQLVVQNYVQQGILTPEQGKAYLIQNNAYNDISTDPNLIQTQNNTLGELNKIANNSGLTPQMQAQLLAIQQDNATKARGANDAVLQGAAQRGTLTGGLAQLAQLTNNQAAAQANNLAGTQVAAQGQQNALDALKQAANLAGNMQSTAFNQAAQKAQAQNAINQFNTANQQSVSNANVNASNAAQAANLAAKQDAADKSITAQNAASAYNANLPQTIFNDTLAKNKASADAASNLAKGYNDFASKQTTSQNNAKTGLAGILGSSGGLGSTISDLTDGIGSIGSGILDFFSDENLKDNVKKDDFDIDSFLNNLTNYKYTYNRKAKDMGMPANTQHGVMAQDLEKSSIGDSLVHNTPDGKMVDYSKSAPVLFASLARINARLNELEGV